MTTRLTLLALSFAFTATACSHATAVDSQTPATAESSQQNQPARKGSGEPAIASSPKSIFKSDTTTKIQKALANRGYEISETGELDGKTRAALVKFQEKEGIAATGMPDRETLKKLELDPDDLLKSNPLKGQGE